MSKASNPQLSVIVPAHDSARVLAESLAALRASDLPRQQWELIVVDDASVDDTARVAEPYADAVLRVDGVARGPAYARNLGTQAARADIIVFVDADVCVHVDTLSKFLAVFTAAPEVSAVFGAYDMTPRAPGLVSQYRNLLHHHGHATQAGAADTFWAGCGAVRRSAFVHAGMFDAERYPHPQIEDIELGYRLRSLGYQILLRPDIQGTHLKRWTLRGIVRNDLRDRAIPWMRLLLEGEAVGPGTLNVRARERWLTVATVMAVLALGAAPIAGSWLLVGFAAACMVLILLANLHLFSWFASVRGGGFALRIIPLRLLYYVLNATAVGIAVVQHLFGRLAGRGAAPRRVPDYPVEPATTEPPMQRRAR